MNNKHLACVIIGLLIFFQLYAVVMINGKAEDMKQQADLAQAAAESAQQQVNVATVALNGQKVSTDALRKYLKEWLPYVTQAANEERGQVLLDQIIAQGAMQSVSEKFSAPPNADNAFIPKILRAELLFEEGYHKSLQWLGELERSLPAARVTRCTLGKGSTGDDVKLTMTVDLPLVAAEAPAPKQ